MATMPTNACLPPSLTSDERDAVETYFSRARKRRAWALSESAAALLPLLGVPLAVLVVALLAVTVSLA